ncbi:MAG: yehU 12 [Herbinix sp.]|jgi:two-component system sensor histidine kinase YesM|nr:yehU 12 [Herbinix sp.]
MGKKLVSKKSFKYRLIVYFCWISIIPIIVMIIVSYYNIATMVQSNVDELTDINLAQTDKNITTVLSSYEDLLYQMYTDDDMVALVDKINAGDNIEVSRNQLRRTLRGLASVKPYIQCITIITDNGSMVFYDKLATSTTNIEWINNYGMASNELYEQIASTNQTDILSTKYAADFSAQPYYLFHMTHRMIDYKNINKKNGVVILSIDERMLNEICNPETVDGENEKRSNLNIIVDDLGAVISFINSDEIGRNVISIASTQNKQEDAYIQMAKDSGLLTGEYLKVYSTYDEELKWHFINVSDQSRIIDQMMNQQKGAILLIVISVFALIIIIIFITNHMTGSIGQIVRAMKVAEKGELSVRVQIDEKMPIEIEIIADQFNHMVTKLNDSIEKEKTATVKQKNAEISALEAQINPHFLYNTLDTINWMAIDKDQYEISNAINSLAKILRYGVDKSNSIVEIKQEVEWLRQYVFLQQTRLKNTFECFIHVDPNALTFHIHKLLLQPFVENAILHGFDGVNEKHELEITIGEEAETINIRISDNGKGMTEQMLQQINQGSFESKEERNHIGISNAIGRFHMYYGTQAKVKIESKLGEGTNIYLEIPKL